jgi:16S rRNA (guanine(966)-N(2))-methyltransferase RsmD
MRVIGGKARGHRLKQVPGDSTRPITDRVKESLFNILADWVVGTRWLDLFAGTGQVGIEALSRGAENAVFIDNARNAVTTIRTNLAHTRLTEQAEIRLQDAFDYLKVTPPNAFDVIYIAPPQYKELWSEALRRIDRQADQILDSDGVVIVQIHPKEFVSLDLQRLALVDQRKYGNTLLVFFEFGGAS